MVWPDMASVVLFLVVVGFTAVSMVVALIWATPPSDRVRTGRRATLAMVGWMMLTGAFALSGVAEVDRPFLAFAPLVIVNLVAAVALGMSPWGRRLATLSVQALVAFHLFRLPLEYVLHLWSEQSSVPSAMSWDGQNFDVLTPIVALVILPFVRRVPWLLLPFQLIGIGMLINIFRIVGQTTPGSPLWVESEGPPLLLAGQFPMVWIVTVCVFGAIAGHVVIARWMWQDLISNKKPIQS